MTQVLNADNTILTMAGEQMTGKELIEQIPGHILGVSTMSDDNAESTAATWSTTGNVWFSNPTITQTSSGATIVSRIDLTVPPSKMTLRLTAEFIVNLGSSGSRVYVGFDTSNGVTQSPNLGWSQFGGGAGNLIEKLKATIDVNVWPDGVEPGDSVRIYLQVASSDLSDVILVGQKYLSTNLLADTSSAGMPIIITAQCFPEDIVQSNLIPVAES